MKRISILIALLSFSYPLSLAQSSENALIIRRENDLITQLTVTGYGYKNGRYKSHPIPCSISIASNYKSLSFSENSLRITYQKGQSIAITVQEENDSSYSQTRQLNWEIMFQDFDDKRHSNMVIYSDIATLEARLIQNNFSLLVPIIGTRAYQLIRDSCFYNVLKGEKFDIFVDKGPLSLLQDEDLGYLYRIRIPMNWKKIDYSNYSKSILIKYPRGQFIQISYSNLIKENSIDGIQYDRISKEEGTFIRSSIKKKPRKKDVAVFLEGTLREGRIYLTILAKKNNIDDILTTIVH